MSFAIRNLSVLAYAQGFTHWHYRSRSDGVEQVQVTTGFFNNAADMIAAGDMILVSAPDGGIQLFVDAVSPSVVVREMCATKGES